MSDLQVLAMIVVLSTLILTGVAIGLRYFNGWSKREAKKAADLREKLRAERDEQSRA